MARSIYFLPSHEVSAWKAGRPNAGGARPATVISTGRAVCRNCGERPAKGETVLSNWYDFTGSGSHTAVTCVLHVSCERPANRDEYGELIDPTTGERIPEAKHLTARTRQILDIVSEVGDARRILEVIADEMFMSQNRARDLMYDLRSKGLVANDLKSLTATGRVSLDAATAGE